eukprot:1158376-Pelagomonas_calceolata.AAC.10
MRKGQLLANLAKMCELTQVCLPFHLQTSMRYSVWRKQAVSLVRSQKTCHRDSAGYAEPYSTPLEQKGSEGLVSGRVEGLFGPAL